VRFRILGGPQVMPSRKEVSRDNGKEEERQEEKEEVNADDLPRSGAAMPGTLAGIVAPEGRLKIDERRLGGYNER
jgi:hypothetical protein